MTESDWKTGKGYPTEKSTLDEWQIEFLRRGPNGITGRPHFKLTDGSVEFFTGPAIVPIEDDGSLPCAPDSERTNATQMVLEFHLDKDIDTQLDKARKLLMANQRARFKTDRRKRLGKYQCYLRALDAASAGVTQSAIASVLYPKLDTLAGIKQVSNDLRAAQKLASEGIPTEKKRR